MTRRGWAYFLAVGLVWGLPYLLIKVAVREMAPVLLVFVRTAGAACVLVPLAAARGALLPALRHWRAIAAYTLFELAVPWVLLANAERRLPSSLTGLVIGSVPIAAALLAWATRSERLDGRRVVGLVVGLTGVGVLAGSSMSGARLVPILSLLGVAIGYAVGPWIVAHRLKGAPPLGVLAWSLSLGAAAYAPAAALSLPSRPLSAPVLSAAAGLTVVCTITGFLLFFALIAEVGALRSTLITYVNPAVAVLLGVFVLGERFGVSTGVGFVFILGGCALASRPLPRTRAGPADPRGSAGAPLGASVPRAAPPT